MKHARIEVDGRALRAAAIDADGLRLRAEDGREVAADAVTFLPPLAPVARPRTILALGLNYADHARELAFAPPKQPLAFVKTEGALAGHGARVPRPADARQMHYENELVAVIGKTARRVRRARALEHVAGYSIACDFAIRDYLENWYRPNLRVKNRDGCTPLGPFLVDAADIGDPQALALETRVDGRVTQRGSTRAMIFDVASLIEYFSAFMTLAPGDLILTGTPDGVVDCPVGARVECAIEGLGTLACTMAAAPADPDFRLTSQP
jgi:5-oxopent-3-ene-1,2,5-tricarboxylate decarboxylase/2-hydroxyhepta-2,4-diene-1,7-dioate isomerase